jgi:hypothetical protein
MVGILVDHAVVGTPEPGVAEAVLVRRHAQTVAGKPKTRPVPSLQAEDVAAAEAAGRVPVRSRSVEVEVRIRWVRVVPDPLIVRVDVRRVRMSARVAVVRACGDGAWPGWRSGRRPTAKRGRALSRDVPGGHRVAVPGRSGLGGASLLVVSPFASPADQETTVRSSAREPLYQIEEASAEACPTLCRGVHQSCYEGDRQGR